MIKRIEPWPPTASLEEIADLWGEPGLREIEKIDALIRLADVPKSERIRLRIAKAACWNFEGKSIRMTFAERNNNDYASCSLRCVILAMVGCNQRHAEVAPFESDESANRVNEQNRLDTDKTDVRKLDADLSGGPHELCRADGCTFWALIPLTARPHPMRSEQAKG